MSIENNEATLEVDAQPDTEQPVKSMDDTLRETLQSINERNTEAAPETPDSPEETAAKLRDTQGKFAKPADDATATETPAETPDTSNTAPNTWKKEAAAKWAELPVEARTEIARREADFHKGIEQYREAAGFAQTMERAISPYAATLKSLNISPDKAIAELMGADHRLRYGQPAEKQAYFKQLAQNYGIDLNGLTAEAQQQEYVDPSIAALQQQVQHLNGYIQNQQNTSQQQAQASLNSEIAAFAADASHSHFETVKPHMIALLQAGQAKDLQDAYEQASFANPVTRTAMLQQQAAATQAENAKKAQAAKQAASVNVRNRPAMPTTKPIGTMDDTLRDTYRRLTGAA